MSTKISKPKKIKPTLEQLTKEGEIWQTYEQDTNYKISNLNRIVNLNTMLILKTNRIEYWCGKLLATLYKWIKIEGRDHGHTYEYKKISH